jgi:hypothetical protein
MHIYKQMKEKSKLNPELNVGDRIRLIHMDDPFSPVTVGTIGKVTNKTKDPFTKKGEYMYGVEWENGRSLNLMPEDSWMIIDGILEQIQGRSIDRFESISQLLTKLNGSDLRKLNQFLLDLRDSGIINMYGATPFIYSGRDWIEKWVKAENFKNTGELELPEDNEKLYEVLDKADEMRNIMARGAMNALRNKEDDFDINDINDELFKLAKEVVTFYMDFGVNL